MDISIKLIDRLCMESLLRFELENKSFFEKTCPPRGEAYYKTENFESVLNELIEEQQNGVVYMYLIYNKFNELVGRVNLVDVKHGNLKQAELGYRIGERHQGKGYATQAVKLILEEAFNKYNINEVKAGVASDNIASQRILIKNGFNFKSKEDNYLFFNEKWHDSFEYIKILTDMQRN